MTYLRGKIWHQPQSRNKRNDSDRNVNEENPLPAESIDEYSPRSGPMRVAIPAVAPQIAIAEPRLCGRNIRVITDMVCGVISPAPRPCTARAVMRPLISPDSPHHNDATVKTAKPSRYRRLGPNRSPSRPAMSSGTA